MEKIRATYYGRVSTDEDDQLNSLLNQISFYGDFFNENNYETVDCGLLARRNGEVEELKGGYADEGISGKSLKKREAFKQMIIDAKNRKFDLIVTKSVARFGRSVEDTAKTVKDLKELGIGVYFLDLKVNSLDNSKEFMINLFASLAQEDSNNKSYIVQFGIRKAQKNGKFTGNAPYGYVIVEGYLQIDEKEAEVVKEIYNLYYYNSYGTGKIARYLNSCGIKTKKGVKWSQIQVSRILDNPIYKGLQIQHMSQTIDINRDIRIEIPEEEWIKHQLDHLIIINPPFFDLVQIEKQRRLELFGDISYIKEKYATAEGDVKTVISRKVKNAIGRHSSTHVFSNLLYCKNCGFSLKRKKRKAYKRKDGTSKDLGYEWTCTQNDMYGKEKCKFRNSVNETDLIDFIRNRLLEFKAEYNHDMTFDMFIHSEIEKENIDEKIQELNSLLEKTQRRIDLNFELLSDGEISREEYALRNTKLQKELSSYKTELQKYDNFENQINVSKLRFELFIKLLKQASSEELTNSTLRKLINKIYVNTPSDDWDIPEEDLFMGRVVNVEWLFIDKNYKDIVMQIENRK